MQVFKLDFKDHPGAVQFCVLVLPRGEGPVSNLDLVAKIRLSRVYIFRGCSAPHHLEKVNLLSWFLAVRLITGNLWQLPIERRP